MNGGPFPGVKEKVAAPFVFSLVFVVEVVVTVIFVQKEWIADHGEMLTDLMFASGFNGDFQQGHVIHHFDGFVVRDGGHFLVYGACLQWKIDRAFAFFRNPLHKCQVGFLSRRFFEHVHQFLTVAREFAKKNHSGGLAIQTVKRVGFESLLFSKRPAAQLSL